MPTTSPSVDAADVARFERLGEAWWNPRGPMQALHKINPVRIGYLRDVMTAHFGALSSLRILDIGCGGGILAEPLARLGAAVTGIDPSPGAIAIAQSHAAGQGIAIDYRAATAESLAAAGEEFDVVLAMEVVEHVTDVPSFVATAASMVAPGGLFFGATLNRTLKSFALAIVGAEYVLRWLPRGTHNWNQFVTPEEFSRFVRRGGLRVIERTGVVYNPLMDAWAVSGDLDVNYMLAAERVAALP